MTALTRLAAEIARIKAQDPIEAASEQLVQVQARIREALSGHDYFVWRLYQNPKVIQCSVCKRLFGLIECELNRRGCDIEVCIPWPHFVRVLSKEGGVEAGARFDVLDIE